MSPTADASSWSTRRLRPQRQYDAWRESVSQTHLAWDLPRRRDGAFRGVIEHQRFGAASIIACDCDPCEGSRGNAQITLSDGEYFGVLHLVAGAERVRQAGREATLGPGDFCLWDSRRPIEFEVGSRLNKLTLLLPQALLRASLPGVDDLVARCVAGAHGRGALFVQHLRTVARERAQVPESHLPGLVSTTIELLANALSPDVPPAAERIPPHHRDRLARAQAYITLHLCEPDLGPERIAADQAMSTRLLFRLFEEAGLSVERQIWSRRLELCRQQLLLRPQESISSIAFRCGFNDAAHFSRAFRERFGLTARDFRRQNLAPR